MQIAANLNLALPVCSHDVTKPDPKDPEKTVTVSEPLVWAYHTPISLEVFEANYRIIAETNATIWGKGIKYAATAGRRISVLTLLDLSKKDSIENDTEDIGPALLAEIRRLTYILAPGSNGFEMLPVDAAIARNVIDLEDWSEALTEIVFFTVGYAMSRRAGRMTFCEFMASVMEGSITSSSLTAFAASLATSTPVETSVPSENQTPLETAEIAE